MCKSKFVTVNKCLGQNGESTSKIIAKNGISEYLLSSSTMNSSGFLDPIEFHAMSF